MSSICSTFSQIQVGLELTYLPGDEGVRLVNRTLIVAEGAMHKVTNWTLWLSTTDHAAFLFSLAIAPTHGEFHRLRPHSQPRQLLPGMHRFLLPDVRNTS